MWSVRRLEIPVDVAFLSREGTGKRDTSSKSQYISSSCRVTRCLRLPCQKATGCLSNH